MRRIRWIILLLVIYVPLLICGLRRGLQRVMFGEADVERKYPYVVAMVAKYTRVCTGTLLSPEWVLTAAHCIICDDCFITHIQYGDMSLLPYQSITISEIHQAIPHPGYCDKDLVNDIAMVSVSPVRVERYGKLSAVDYYSLKGYPVEYAGYGETEYNDAYDDRRPLFIGQGLVVSCIEYYKSDDIPAAYVCVAPKCCCKNGDAANGDSGGPLFFDNKIVGIVSTGYTPIGFYAAISPYITWISNIINSKSNLLITVDQKHRKMKKRKKHLFDTISRGIVHFKNRTSIL